MWRWCGGAGGIGGKADDVILTRFGKQTESIEKLGKEAADAKNKMEFRSIYYISTKYPGAPSHRNQP